MAGLSVLVDDVILMIAEELQREGDLSAFCRADRRLYRLLNPFLYRRHVRFHSSSALSWAAAHGQIDTAEKLLAAGADPNSAPQMPALLVAATNSQVGFMRYLLRAETLDPNREGFGDGTPLIAAAQLGHLEMTELLLADPRIVPDRADGNQRTALSHAVSHRHKDVVRALLSRGDVNPGSSNDVGNTVISFAAATARSNVTIMKLLLQDPRVDPTVPNTLGSQPLHHAAFAGNTEHLSFLISLGLDPDCSPGVTGTPLIAAAGGNKPDAVRLLLSTPGVDPNARAPGGRTALLVAASNGESEALGPLVADPRVDVNLVCRDGFTALMHAMRRASIPMAGTLLERNDLELNKRIPPDDQPLVSFLAMEGRAGLLRVFLCRPDLETRVKDNRGLTPMMAAAARGSADIVELLYRDGRFDIDGLSILGRNAMSYAAEAGSVEVVEKLLEIEEKEAGRVKWNVATRFTSGGLTPLDYAKRGGKAAVVELLSKRYSPDSY